MKTIIRCLLLLALIATAACGRRKAASGLFRWQPLVPAADSLVQCLERGFIDVVPDDTLEALCIRLRGQSALHPDCRQLLARVWFWEARLSNRRHLPALEALEVARHLCDSAAYPYDRLRIDYLTQLELGRQDIGVFYGALKALEARAAADRDSFMTASLSLDIGHVLLGIGDGDRALEYYEKADGLYRDLGVVNYHLKTQLNNITVMHGLGRTDESRRACLALLDDSCARADREFHCKLLLTAAEITGDASYLRQGYSLLAGCRRHLAHLAMTYETNLAEAALQDGDAAAASRYAHMAAGHGPLPPRLATREHLYSVMCRLYALTGDRDSVARYAVLLAEVRDSLLGQKDGLTVVSAEHAAEVARVEERASIARHHDRLAWLSIVCATLVCAAAVVIVLMRRSAAAKLRLMASRLELEKSQRRALSSSLAMTEKDNVLETVLGHIEDIRGGSDPVSLSRLQQSIRMHLAGRQDWEDFQRLFEQVHPSFAHDLKQRYPGLTEGDLRLATYIKLGLETNQIARMLLVQTNTIKKNRQRLRRRMDLAADQSLEDVLRNTGA